MPYTPNWIVPADVIRSASAGASAGLSARAHDLQEAAQRQAADEFITRLNQQASQFERNLASEHDIAASRLAQALRAQDALDIYRKGELDVRNKDRQSREGIASDKLASEMLRQDALGDYRKSQLEATKENRAAVKDYRDARLKQFDQALNSPSKLFENNPEVIIAKSALANAKENQAKRTTAEQQLREALATPAQRAAAAQTFKSALEQDRARFDPVMALQPTNAPSAAPVKEAVGGYKVGKSYRGLKYLGGDPNDESNWQPVR